MGRERRFSIHSVTRASEWLVSHEWLVLAAIALPMVFPRPWTTPLMLVIPGMWALRYFRRGRFLPPTPMNLPILLLTCTVGLSLWATFSISFSLQKISGVVYGIGIFFAVAEHCLVSRGLQNATRAFLVFGVGAAVLGLVGTDWREKLPFLEELTFRLPLLLRGLPGAEAGIHPNELGGVLLIPSPLAFVIAVEALRRRGRSRWLGTILWALIASLLVGLVLLTQSRSAILGLVAASSLLLIAAGRVGRLAFYGLLSMSTILTLVLISGQGGYPLDLPILEKLSGAYFLPQRAEIWSRAICGIRDFPISGMGLGTFQFVAPLLYPFLRVDVTVMFSHAHNLYLQTALDLGIPGLVSYLALCMTAAGALYSVWRDTSQESQLGISHPRVVALGLGSGLLAHSVYGITDAVALGARAGFLWWMALGLAAGVYVRGLGSASKQS